MLLWVHPDMAGIPSRGKGNTPTRADLGRGCRGCAPPPEMTCGFLINTVQSASQLYKICFIIWYVFSAVHIMLLPSRKPSSSYSLLKFVYVTSQLRHSLVVHPLLRKILDPPLSQMLHATESAFVMPCWGRLSVKLNLKMFCWFTSSRSNLNGFIHWEILILNNKNSFNSAISCGEGF